MYKVLILGAGLVAKPIVEYLIERDFKVLIATSTREKADRIIKGHPHGSSLKWSMDDTSTLDLLINESDITVSLLPYRYHAEVAKICINKRKPLVTTSYVQPDMQALDEPAKNAGVIILNETGLDPGIDHMSAMRIIDHIHSRAGKVEEFYSLCGALPAPEAADNPLRYKFSWSPKGVILASLNSALYLKKGKRVAIDPVNLFKDRFTCSFPGIGELEVYPNRDSIRYIDIYGIPETKTMYRGTFRFKGWCETLDAMKSLNMLDDAVEDYTGKTYSEFMAMRAGTGKEDIRKSISARLRISPDSTPITSLEWLGFFSGETVPFRKTSPVEITSDRMIKKMTLANDDRDMVVLQHIFLASFPDGSKEVIKSGMIDYGTPSTNTSIARTVALPAAIAVKMILEKKIDLTGVYRPVVPQIYNPVLDELKLMGIELKEEFGLPESSMFNE